MKAILAAILIAPCAATTFQPCPRPIDAPPVRLTIINTQTPNLECARRAENPLIAAMMLSAVGCANDGLIVIAMDGPVQFMSLGALKSPDEALGHEARHAIQRWRHAPLLSNTEGVCK